VRREANKEKPMRIGLLGQAVARPNQQIARQF
jgi:hypothetical protein